MMTITKTVMTVTAMTMTITTAAAATTIRTVMFVANVGFPSSLS